MVTTKKAYNYNDEVDEGDAFASRPTPQERIVIERREYVGEIVPNAFGEDRMVVAAFKMAGQYIDEIASKSDSGPIRLQFEYGGRTFIAAVDPED